MKSRLGWLKEMAPWLTLFMPMTKVSDTGSASTPAG